MRPDAGCLIDGSHMRTPDMHLAALAQLIRDVVQDPTEFTERPEDAVNAAILWTSTRQPEIKWAERSAGETMQADADNNLFEQAVEACDSGCSILADLIGHGCSVYWEESDLWLDYGDGDD